MFYHEGLNTLEIDAHIQDWHLLVSLRYIKRFFYAEKYFHIALQKPYWFLPCKKKNESEQWSCVLSVEEKPFRNLKISSEEFIIMIFYVDSLFLCSAF